MPVALRKTAALDPVDWPTGEEVPVKRPNTYAAKFWDDEVVGQANIREGLIRFVGMICPSKTEAQIREECDDEYLWLVANYSRGALEAARTFLELAMGKAGAAMEPPPSFPPTSTGMSPAASPALAGMPCGS